jgi:hypothetical protein
MRSLESALKLAEQEAEDDYEDIEIQIGIKKEI